MEFKEVPDAAEQEINYDILNENLEMEIETDNEYILNIFVTIKIQDSVKVDKNQELIQFLNTFFKDMYSFKSENQVKINITKQLFSESLQTEDRRLDTLDVEKLRQKMNIDCIHYIFMLLKKD